jgi:formylglycine-generating enzyme required for sulfatase activity
MHARHAAPHRTPALTALAAFGLSLAVVAGPACVELPVVPAADDRADAAGTDAAGDVLRYDLDDDASSEAGDADPHADSDDRAAAPRLVLTAPSAGATVRGLVPIRLHALTVPAAPPAPAPRARFDFRERGTDSEWVPIADEVEFPFETVWDASALPPGPYLLRAALVGPDAPPDPVAIALRVVAPCAAPGCADGGLVIRAPADGATVCGDIPVVVTSALGFAVDRVEARVDGVPLAGDPLHGDAIWSGAAASPGTYALEALALLADEVVAFDRVGVTLDPDASPCLAPPTVWFESPADGSYHTGDEVVPIHLGRSHPGRELAELNLDSADVTLAGREPHSAAFDWRPDGADAGRVTLQAALHTRPAGAAPAQSDLATVSFTIDRDAPAVALASPAPGATLETLAEVVARASDPTSGVLAVEIRIAGRDETFVATPAPDGEDWTASLDLTGLACGDHTLHARATDLAGRSAESEPLAVTLGCGADAACIAGSCVPEGFALIEVDGQTHTLGSPTDEPARDDDETRHTARLGADFIIGATEVTRRQWAEVYDVALDLVPGGRCVDPATGDDLAGAALGDCPVAEVTWWAAVDFTIQRSRLDDLQPCYELRGLEGDCAAGTCLADQVVLPEGLGSVYECEGYLLPTEAEWEVAYRLGSEAPFYVDGVEASDCDGDEALESIARYCRDGGAPQPVAGRAPRETTRGGLDGNAPLFDLAGNLAEWVYDAYGDYEDLEFVGGEPVDPVRVPVAGESRSTRGGAFSSYVSACRAASRESRDPEVLRDFIGFRLARRARPAPATSPSG